MQIDFPATSDELEALGCHADTAFPNRLATIVAAAETAQHDHRKDVIGEGVPIERPVATD